MSSVPTPQPPQPPQVPAQNSSQVLWWILGILGGGIALLVMLGLMIGGAVLRHLNVREKGDKVEIETSVGSIRVNSDSAHPTGLPIYPGATRVKSEGANVELSARDGLAVGVGVEKYSTSDDLEKVSAWYVQKLGPSYHREKSGHETHYLHGTDSDNANIVYVNDSGDGARVVALTSKSSGVEIALIRAGKKEVQ
jgi:hypothetical protein